MLPRLVVLGVAAIVAVVAVVVAVVLWWWGLGVQRAGWAVGAPHITWRACVYPS